jgi:type IV pilus assembly protein PilV
MCVNKSLQRGLTLIESMVALVVITIGLLGLASLQLTGMQQNSSALHQSKAVWAGYTMADRIRANNIRFANYSGIDTNDPYSQDCMSGPCNNDQLVTADAAEWTDSMRDLPGGRGQVTGDANQLIITVMWDDEGTGVTGTGCSGNAQVDLTCYSVNLIP